MIDIVGLIGIVGLMNERRLICCNIVSQDFFHQLADGLQWIDGSVRSVRRFDWLLLCFVVL